MNQPIAQDRTLPSATLFVSAAELQSRLFDLGYYDGPVDGLPRQLTITALAKFQHDHGLTATGDPDPVTMQIMRETYCY